MISSLAPRSVSKWALISLIALSLSACASKKEGEDGFGAGGANGGRFGSGAGGAGGAPGSTQDFTVNVGDRIFFESDSSELTGTAQSTLDKQAQWLNQYSRYSFTVEGHADERGTREYNFALGARRAETVKNYLIARGIPASRMRNISFGKERPVATCDDISCWSQNRRSVTVLSGSGS